MEILGSQIIPASQQAVWDALNSPDVLKKCLPGCESVELVSPDLFQVLITAAIGPLKAKFKGTLHVTEINAPQSCVLVFEGQGGAVGFGKGSSSVTLKAVEGGTELTYSAKAHVGGKLAQIGSRLIDSVAKKMSDDFFKAFNQELGGQSSSNSAVDLNSEDSTAPQVLPSAISTAQPSDPIPHGSKLQTQQVPASWLIIAAAVGSGITIVAALILG